MPLYPGGGGGGVSAHSGLTGLTSGDDHSQYLSVQKQRAFGYTTGGLDPSFANSAVTEKYADVANSWTAKANLNTARYNLAGFSLNGFGYTAGGSTGSNSAVCEKYDDVANSWTTKANLNTARYNLAGFSLNGFGYTAGGTTGSNSAVTEKYDDVANTWTAKANLNTAIYNLAGFSLGYLTESYYTSPELVNLQRMLKDSAGYFQTGSVGAFSSTVVLFPMAFPSAPQVFITSTTGTVTLAVTTKSAGSFTFSSSSAVAFDWTAIIKTTGFRGVA